MSKNYYCIPLNRCLKTEDIIINEIQKFLCCICGNIPLPPFRDKQNNKNVFCQGCCRSKGVNEIIRPGYDELKFLKQLIIDCKNECDEIFSFDIIAKLPNHEENCNFKRTIHQDYNSDNKLNFCKKCDIICDVLDHDCIAFMNLKIKEILEDVNELKTQNEAYKNEIEILNNESKVTKNSLKKIEDNSQNNFSIFNNKFSNLENQTSSLSATFIQSNQNIGKINSSSEQLLDTLNNKVKLLEDQIKENISSTENAQKKFSQLNQLQIKYENSLLIHKNETEELLKSFEKKFTQEQQKLDEEIKELKQLIPTILYTVGEISLINDKINALYDHLKKAVLDINENNPMRKTTLNNFADFTISLNHELILKSREMVTSEINKLKELMNFNNSTLLSNLRKKINSYRNHEIIGTHSSIILSDNIQENVLSVLEESYNNLLNVDEKELFKIQCDFLNKEIIQFNSEIKIAFGQIQNVIEKTHSNNIYAILLNKNNDNRHLISSSEKSIIFWDLNSNSNVGCIDNAHTGIIYTILIINNMLISGGDDKLIKFWDLNTFKPLSGEINNKNSVFNLINNDNDTIIAASHIDINIYDINTKTLVSVIETNHSDYIYILIKAKINNDDIILSGSIDKTIKVWKDKKCLKNIDNVHTSRISCIIKLKSDDNIIVSSDYEGNIAFININDDFQLERKYERSFYYTENDNKIYSTNLYELKDRNIIVSTSSISTLTFWSLKNFEIIRNLRINKGIRCLIGIDNDEQLIFNIGSDIIIWK